MKNKFLSKLLLLALVMFGLILAIPDSSEAASHPFDVPTNIKNNWDDNKGSKGNVGSGYNLVYDIYKNKYSGIPGGYRIVNMNFNGRGSEPYIHFRGHAFNAGRQYHTSSNNNVYIVARKVGSTTTKIYSTLKLALSATEDMEYNKSASTNTTIWNPCGTSARDRVNTDCNMKYDGVGFEAYLPLEELFPNYHEGASWRLWIVHEVNGRIVYNDLKVPFDFDNLSHNGGEISLSSGVNASRLTMNGDPVIRRTSARSNESGATRGYFTQGQNYTRVSQNEDNTVIWYGVRSPHDSNATRWASSAYWTFGGDQAILKFEPDDVPPVHISDSLSSHMYKNGNDYWTQPNDQVVINLRQRDVDSGNQYQYLRLHGSGQDVRSRHSFTNGTSDKTDLAYKSNYLKIDYASRTENTSYGRVNWGVTPKRHGDTFNVMWHYTDKAKNARGYDTGEGHTDLRLRVDGEAPTHYAGSLGSQYTGSDGVKWVKPGTNTNVRLRQYDPDSGNKHQYLRVLRNGSIEARSVHTFSEGATHNNKQVTSSYISIDSADREQKTAYGTILWTMKPNTHGHIYDVQYYYEDNVKNASGYSTLGKLGIDGKAPVVSFRNSADNANFTSRGWELTPIEVRLKFSDAHSGYSKSRYAWSKSTSTPSSWSSWLSSSNYVVSKAAYGEWYLHVQSEDNLGNTVTTYKGPYRFNNPPKAGFELDQSWYYVGDPVNVTSLATDPDNNALTYDYTITLPNGSTVKKTIANFSYKLPDMPGVYKIKQVVTDIHGASDSISTSFEVRNLYLTGFVKHTESWEENHAKNENSPLQFYSGEIFVLEGVVTDHPIDRIKVDFSAPQTNGNTYSKSLLLNKINSTLYSGEIDDQKLAESGTRLRNGNATFTFTAYYSNGIVRTDSVTIEIIGDVYDAFNYHKRY